MWYFKENLQILWQSCCREENCFVPSFGSGPGWWGLWLSTQQNMPSVFGGWVSRAHGFLLARSGGCQSYCQAGTNCISYMFCPGAWPPEPSVSVINVWGFCLLFLLFIWFLLLLTIPTTDSRNRWGPSAVTFGNLGQVSLCFIFLLPLGI